MRGIRGWIVGAVLIPLMAPSAAYPQSLNPPVNPYLGVTSESSLFAQKTPLKKQIPAYGLAAYVARRGQSEASHRNVALAVNMDLEPLTEKPRKEKVDRLRVGAYAALWEYPDILHLDLELASNVGPVITADYFLTKHLSVGGWYNQISGNFKDKRRADRRTLGTYDIDFYNIHADYYLPEAWVKGLVLQAGFSGFHQDLKFNSDEFLFNRLRDTFHSPSIWLTEWREFGRRQGEGGRARPSVYGSLGYYTSSEFQHATNIIVGGSIGLSRRFSLGGSVWVNDLNKPNIRTTLGLTGTF